jgi:hypothetical protein
VPADNAGEIREDVLRFIADRIDTVPHLEALQLIWESSGRPWSAEEIASRIYVNAPTAANILQDLLRHRLIVSDGATPPRYHYDPNQDPHAQLLPEVIATYRRHLVRIAQFIHSKGSPAVREFARAFQIKKE